MQTSKWSIRVCLFAFLAVPSLVLAQGTVSPGATPPPAAAPAAATPAAQPATPPATQIAPAATGEEALAPCFPACREGFLCSAEGQCISACNPGCGPGERCNAAAQCVIDSQVTATAPSAPLYTPPPEQPAPPAEHGVETHDGIMLRFTVGIGGGSMSDELDDDVLLLGGGGGESSASGAGFMGSVDVGAGITDELTLHGRIGLLEMFDPRLENADGDEIDPPYQKTLVALIIGPGVTYNIMPLNLYVTGVAGLNIVGLTFDEEDGDFRDEFRDHPTAGFGINLDVGKEWWVTNQTGIGLAGRFWWGTGGSENELDGIEISSSRNLLAFGLLFSITHQ